MSTHNICYNGELTKNILQLSSVTCLILSTAMCMTLVKVNLVSLIVLFIRSHINDIVY